MLKEKMSSFMCHNLFKADMVEFVYECIFNRSHLKIILIPSLSKIMSSISMKNF